MGCRVSSISGEVLSAVDDDMECVLDRIEGAYMALIKLRPVLHASISKACKRVFVKVIVNASSCLGCESVVSDRQHQEEAARVSGRGHATAYWHASNDDKPRLEGAVPQ